MVITIDNLMFHPDRLEIIAVFDWELSTLGHPLADLSYQVVQRYMDATGISDSPGLIRSLWEFTSEQAVDRYCAFRHYLDIGLLQTFSFFRFATIARVSRSERSTAMLSQSALEVGGWPNPWLNWDGGWLREKRSNVCEFHEMPKAAWRIPVH